MGKPTPKCTECQKPATPAREGCAHVDCPLRKRISAAPAERDPRPVKLGVPDIGKWFFDKQD